MRRARSAGTLLNGTCLSTPISRLAIAVLLGAGTLAAALPARAADIFVSNALQLNDAIGVPGATVIFTTNITLHQNLRTVENGVTIKGNNFTLSGDNQYRGLFVPTGTVAINDLNIVNAKAQGGTGGNGDGGPGGGGGAGLGGALFVGATATVTVSNVNMQNGSARGGDGGGTSGSSNTSGGGGGYWITGANGGNGNFFVSGGGGTGGGGDGSTNSTGGSGGFGGAGGGGSTGGGNGGFGGGGGGSSQNPPNTAPGGFLGGAGGRLSEAGNTFHVGGGGGGAGLGGAVFVQEGGSLSLAGSLSISGNSVAGGNGGSTGYLSNGQAGGAAGSGIFLQGNGSLTLAPAAGQTQTISDTIADQTGAGGTGANAGSWSLVKDAAGTTILTGANAYTGGTTVNSGVLQGNSGSLQGNILNNASVVFDQAGDGTYAGTMSGTGALTKIGAGTLTLSGTNSFAGGITVDSGTLLFNSDANLGAAGKGILLNNGTIGVASGDGGQIINRPITITNAGALYVSQNVTNPVTWSGVISGLGTLIVDGGGQVVLSGANTYSGGTKVSGGNLLFSTDANLGAAGTGITLNNGIIGTTKDAVAALSINRPITLTGGGEITVALNPLTWSGNISGDGHLTKAGAGVLTLTGTNTYTGGTMVAFGTLQVASDDKLGAAGTGVTLVNNGGLWATSSFTSNRPFALANPGGTFQVSDGQTLTLTGSIAGGTLGLVGTGTLVLAGTSTYSGINNFGGTVQGNTETLRGNIFFDTNAGNPNARSVTFDQATDGTFAGTISGIGSLTKIGAGKLILSGDNTYSAGTTVSAGTLQGTSRSLQGDIRDNATVIFDQNFDGTYSGKMDGSGVLMKKGTGRLDITGTVTVLGGLTVNDGRLAANGNIASDVTLNGGILSGSGHIKGNITQNGGTIRPGNSIGNITVDGNLTVNNGTLAFEISPTASDRITIVGAGHTATLISGTLVVQPDPGTYVPNTTYIIASGPNGGYANFSAVTGSVGFLVPALSFDANNLYLSMVLAPNAFRSAGQTVNQQAVGGALDAIAAGGNVGGLVTALANMPTTQGAAAFQAMSAEPYADFGTVNVQANQLFMNTVGRQMSAVHGINLGASGSVALAAACDVACDGEAPPPRFSGWLSGIGATGTVTGDNNAAGLTYTLGGTAFGIDYRLDPRFVVGIAGAYAGGTQWVNGFAGNGYTDQLSAALYGSFAQGPVYVDGLAGYANANNRTQRIVSIPGLQTGIVNGQTNANTFLGQIESGYQFAIDRPPRTSITPFGRLQVSSVNQAGFTESGQSFFNLAVAPQTTTSVRTTFGADLAASFELGGKPLDLGLRLGWMHEFANTARPITAGFAAAPGPQFTVFGAAPQADNAVIGFSAAAAISDRTSVFLSYDGEVGGGTANHQLRAGFRLIF
ncbi:MAG: autotransporter domain-containing protein [Alphaproteobacteria bacterium]|nr:autotransporter domain-containing protein [Alphaproteobacteria bacterium]